MMLRFIDPHDNSFVWHGMRLETCTLGDWWVQREHGFGHYPVAYDEIRGLGWKISSAFVGGKEFNDLKAKNLIPQYPVKVRTNRSSSGMKQVQHTSNELSLLAI